MLPEFFQCPRRVRDLRGGPAVPRRRASREGASGRAWELTARRHLRSAEHLAQWASRVGIALDGPIEPILDGFDRHLQRQRQCPAHGCRPFGHTFRVQILSSARLFLNHLADGDLAFRHPDNRVVPFPPLFVGFCRWMQQQRGACASTLANYEIHICELLRRVGEEPARWDARGLREFVMEGSRMWVGGAKKRTTALRMFLRFLIAEGRCASELHEAVPVLVHRRLSSLPRYLSADDVERILRSRVGRRPA